MKDKIHPLDKTDAIYNIECTKHDTEYVGETGRAMKQRGHEHYIIDYDDMRRNHSIPQKTIENQRNIGVRRNERLKTKDRINYKSMNSGRNIKITEGNTEVSQHIATLEHDKDDIIMTAITYQHNKRKRKIQEAIEIKKRNPRLNKDPGYFLPTIYDTVDELKNEREKFASRRNAGNLPQNHIWWCLAGEQAKLIMVR